MHTEGQYQPAGLASLQRDSPSLNLAEEETLNHFEVTEGNKQLCHYTGSSKKMDGIWNRCNLKRTRRIYTFGVLKCSEKFKVLDLP